MSEAVGTSDDLGTLVDESPPPSVYTVLARKYRPSQLDEVVGQDHTVRALSNALTNERYHHAYLLTGTRGVGKTTIGRILAKCLNCEVGVSAKSCDACMTCKDIASGTFVDLLEIDAATNTKVEEIRSVLENVQYLPSRGRFKVYLIDEVHMLSTHSFNALLKTLEEPPEHAKFVLATTNPEKVPATVLSRCLQFHLKNILPSDIQSHLAEVLTNESASFDDDSLRSISRSARGSMRDALSITDQALALCEGVLRHEVVSEMLGSARSDEVALLLGHIANQDRDALFQLTGELASRAVDFADLLAKLQSAVHELALAQATDGKLSDELEPFRQSFSKADLQLAYQTLIMTGRDLQYAPDGRIGFEMGLLRVLYFQAETFSDQKVSRSTGTQEPPPAAKKPKNRSNHVESKLTERVNRASTNTPEQTPVTMARSSDRSAVQRKPATAKKSTINHEVKQKQGIPDPLLNDETVHAIVKQYDGKILAWTPNAASPSQAN